MTEAPTTSTAPRMLRTDHGDGAGRTLWAEARSRVDDALKDQQIDAHFLLGVLIQRVPADVIYAVESLEAYRAELASKVVAL